VLTSCIAPPRLAKVDGEGMPISSGIMHQPPWEPVMAWEVGSEARGGAQPCSIAGMPVCMVADSLLL
jgi:hypothetical protein